jgi:hypothetical protein
MSAFTSIILFVKLEIVELKLFRLFLLLDKNEVSLEEK